MPKEYDRCPDCGEIHQVNSTEEAIDIAEKHLVKHGHGQGQSHDIATQWLDSITEMKELGLLEKNGQREDGEPIASEDLIGNFIKELDYDKSFELQWRLLRQEEVAPTYRHKMVTAMLKAILNVTGRQEKERLEGFITIISTLVPFNSILFPMGAEIKE